MMKDILNFYLCPDPILNLLIIIEREMMLDFQLSIQPETEKRLKKILTDIKDEENFAQSIIDYQIAELKKSNLNLKLDLVDLEKQYQMKSEEFYQKFSQGILGDEDDFMVWSGLYEMLLQNEVNLNELK